MSKIRTCLVFAISVDFCLCRHSLRARIELWPAAAPAPRTRQSQSHKLHGQQAIDSARVTEIQGALVRAHYLTAEPNGKWDAAPKRPCRSISPIKAGRPG